MALEFELTKPPPAEVDAFVVGVPSDRVGDDAYTGRTDIAWSALRAQRFEGTLGQVASVHRAEGPDLVVVGLGPVDRLDALVVREAAANAARCVSARVSVAIGLAGLVPVAERPAAVQAVVEGMSLATYRFDRFKSSPSPVELRRVCLSGVSGKRAEAAMILGRRVADAVAFARDLVNTPGGELTAPVFAQAAVEVAEREDLQITVLGPDEIAEAGLGGLLGVNRGSNIAPRFVEICFEPVTTRGGAPKGTLALVGKGITFDSGGLSIKTGEGMMTMKDDMGGAAAVLGAFSALRAVAPKCRVVGYLPLTDNMSGGDATRPGDVLQIRNGKTVEVLNTDAEGRLVLADALSMASEARPDAIVDLATLTGAVEVALGSRIAGLMGNHDGWLDQVRVAAGTVGERVWPLPLPDDYRANIESDVADLRNISKTKGGGTITAGLFLREFVGEGIAWAHLDIAGTAWSGEADAGELSRGGTGFGVRTLLELARTFRPPR